MTREDIFNVIESNIVSIIDGASGKEINESLSMRDLGADSLQIIEVVSRSMKQLKIKVYRTELSTAKNLKDLIDLFEAAAKKNERAGKP
jgi:acyl carrier protein